MGTKPRSIDLPLLLLTIGLSLFGILMVYNASVAEAYQLFADKFYFLKLQSVWVLLGFLGLTAAVFVPLDWVKKLSPPFLLVNFILLILVLLPGFSQETYGARRWVNLGSLNLQPTELIKLSLTLYLSAWLSKQRSFFSFLIILGVILGLVMLQPDLGTALVIIFSAITVYYVSGANLIYLIVVGILGLASGSAFILLSPYRKTRLLTFLNPARDPLGASYHIRQALIAIGSGGLFGLGLGQSRQKYQFLPQVTTDSIFAIIAEELGFFGAAVLIVALFSVILRGLKIAKYAPDIFSRLLAVGISAWLGIQTVINIAAMLALVPLTGVPLPFISYGGSSLVVILTAVGLLLNISRFQLNPKKTR